MAVFIEMPKLSDTMKEGTLVKWHVREGDSVSVGDVIADVETDKATMEMEAFGAGILGKIYVPEGSKAPLGGILAALVEEGEEAPAAPPAPGKPASQREAAPEQDQPEARQTLDKGRPGPAQRPAVRLAPGGRVKSSPLARKIAARLGVDLGSVQGTGPGSRIVRTDVERAAAEMGGSRASGEPAPGGFSVPVIRPSMDFDPGAKRIPVSGMRAIIAERLQASKATIPHFYLNVELDAGPLMAMRKEVNETGAHKYTVNDFVLKAIIMAVADVPGVNAAWDGDAIVQYTAVNLAVAVAIPDGLVTPVIRNAQTKTLLEVSREVKDLAERARNKRLSPDQFAGGTLTVSNLGPYGIDSFEAIINPPQSVILSIGNIRKIPVVAEGGELEAGQRVWVGMSCDHRVVDGAVGATYLQALRKYLENPALMLV